MNTPPSYSFVVEDAKGDFFELDITAYDNRAKQHFQSVWQRLSLALDGVRKIETLTMPGWVGWQPWKWCEDRRPAYQPRQTFVAWCGDNQTGILNVWAGFDSVHAPGNKTLYVEHVGAAPGNLDTTLWNRRYRGVGQALMAYAVKVSSEQGFDGRVTLHAADATALGFYRHLHTKMGGNLFYPEQTGILGPTPHAVGGDAGRTFLEIKQTEAERLLEVYRA
jgi:hypothetical protein